MRTLAVSFIAGLAVLALSTPVTAQSAKRFPAIDTFDLGGAPRQFPSGLPTPLTLLIVAFDRDQQPAADRLFKLVDEAEIAKRGIATIETPVIQDPGGPGRFFIDNGMRLGIRDEEKRKIVVTLYVKDLAAWLSETGLPSKDAVFLMAVTRSGRIVRTAREQAISDAAAMKAFVAQAEKQLTN